MYDVSHDTNTTDRNVVVTPGGESPFNWPVWIWTDATDELLSVTVYESGVYESGVYESDA